MPVGDAYEAGDAYETYAIGDWVRCNFAGAAARLGDDDLMPSNFRAPPAADTAIYLCKYYCCNFRS